MTEELLNQMADEYGEQFPDSDVDEIKHFIAWMWEVLHEEDYYEALPNRI